MHRNTCASESWVVLFGALPALLLGLACAGGPLAFESGPDAKLTQDGLRRLEGTSFDRAWGRPGRELSRYQRILLVAEGVEYQEYRKWPYASRSAIDFALEPFEPEPLEGALRNALVEALFGDGAWKVAEVPGPDVLRIRVSLIEVTVTVPPEPLSPRDAVVIESAGDAVLAISLEESLTQEALVRVADREEFEGPGGGMMASNAINNRAAVRRTSEDWADRLRRLLDELRAVGLPEAPGA